MMVCGGKQRNALLSAKEKIYCNQLMCINERKLFNRAHMAVQNIFIGIYTQKKFSLTFPSLRL